MKTLRCKDPLRLADHLFVESNPAGGESFDLCLAENLGGQTGDKYSHYLSKRSQALVTASSKLAFPLYVICHF